MKPYTDIVAGWDTGCVELVLEACLVDLIIMNKVRKMVPSKGKLLPRLSTIAVISTSTSKIMAVIITSIITFFIEY